ncbi:hypothetical protein AC578_8433 [Pseudocercospora eumusae]|uniref:Cytochrome P450 n=1 Tax=Pseudocercospora eumusae TaxID=321146 RepID=A0A139HRU0_9PEZI|nr:hypothetical protein AC578_8433 [Pseudocercospora eumusae]
MLVDYFSKPWTNVNGFLFDVSTSSDTRSNAIKQATYPQDDKHPPPTLSHIDAQSRSPLGEQHTMSPIRIIRTYLFPIAAASYVLAAQLKSLDNRLHYVAASLATIWLFSKLAKLSKAYSRSKRFSSFARSNGCFATTGLPTPVLSSLRHKLDLLFYLGDDLLDNVFAKKFNTYGATHALHDPFGVPKVIHTIDPVNLNAILNKSHTDWAPSKSRARTMYPLAQEGLLNSEGEAWHKNRKMVMRHIGTKRAKDVRQSEGDIQLLFTAIGPADQDGWTGVVDLLDLFHRLSLDMSTTFLLGTSADSQLNGMRETRLKAAMEEFDLVPSKQSKAKMSYGIAYETVRNHFSWRSKLGSKYWMADSPRYRKACATLNKFADDLIARAIDRRRGVPDGVDIAEFGLVDSLVKDIGDPIQIRNLVMDLFIAGQNMTGTMAAWVFAQLEAHPDIFQRVRAEVLDKFGAEEAPLAPLTWDNLRSCTTMQHVILETLRMYPLLANIGRNAKRDTVLPRGGGEDGMQPIAVPKGAAITANVYLMHRREQEWGEDAWDFKPDRWIGRKIAADYAPFGMGPRICVGQQLTMTEMSYLMARMMQHFSEMKAPEGQDNLTKGYRVVVAPKNGVKVRLRRCRPLNGSPMLGALA